MVIVRSSDTVAWTVELRTEPVTPDVEFRWVWVIICCIVRPLHQLQEIGIVILVLEAPLALAATFWHGGVISRVFFAEHSIFIDRGHWYLVTNDPKRSHQYDGRNNFDRCATRIAIPDDKVLAHKRLEVSKALTHLI